LHKKRAPLLKYYSYLASENKNRLTSKFERAKIFLREHMKSISLFLILSLILCYTGLGVGVSRSYSLSITTDCHTGQQNRVSETRAIANCCKNNDAKKHGTCICFDALTNATYSHDFNQKDILYSVAFYIPILKINEVSSFFLSLTIKKEYQPPELYLANSSFLL
jgi:hypothetical protein